jgi:hypothetical protein
MAHACKKPSSELTEYQANKFCLSLTHSSNKKRPTATSVARAFNVNEKTVQDIWSARTWCDETLPLDVNRTPRAAKKIGRPPVKIDSKPRKPRTVKSLASTQQTQATDNAEPKSPLYCASGDSSSDQPEILGLSCDDFATISSQPEQESFPVPAEEMQQIGPGLLHGRRNKSTFPRANSMFPQTCSTIPRHINFTPRTSSRLDFGQFQSDNGRLHWLGCSIAPPQCRLSGQTRTRVSHLQD